MTVASAGCYGKLPIHGDFIRHRTPAREIDLLDDWLQGGIVSSRQALAGGWDASFDGTPPQRFLFHPHRGGHVLGGVMVPSRDKAGRRFPFLVFTAVEAAPLGAEATILPSFLSEFLDRGQEAALSAWRGVDLRAFLARLDALSLPSDLPAARKRVAEYVTEGTNLSFWSGLLGSADDPRKYLVVHNLIETLRGGAIPRYALRIPRVSGPAEVSFWLDLSRRLARRPGLPTLSLWGPGRGEAAPGLTILFDDLLPKYFLPFLWPERRSDLLYPLVGDPSAAPGRLQQARERYGPLLDDASMQLSALVGRLAGG